MRSNDIYARGTIRYRIVLCNTKRNRLATLLLRVSYQCVVRKNTRQPLDKASFGVYTENYNLNDIAIGAGTPIAVRVERERKGIGEACAFFVPKNRNGWGYVAALGLLPPGCQADMIRGDNTTKPAA